MQFMNHSLQRSIAFSFAMKILCADGALTTVYNRLSKTDTNHNEYKKCIATTT